MKKIIIVVFFTLLILAISSISAETPFEQSIIASVSPNTRVIIFVDYPDSQPLKYTGNYVADLKNAVLIKVNDKFFFIRKEFIQKFSILPDTHNSSLALNSPQN